MSTPLSWKNYVHFKSPNFQSTGFVGNSFTQEMSRGLSVAHSIYKSLICHLIFNGLPCTEDVETKSEIKRMTCPVPPTRTELVFALTEGSSNALAVPKSISWWGCFHWHLLSLGQACTAKPPSIALAGISLKLCYFKALGAAERYGTACLTHCYYLSCGKC